MTPQEKADELHIGYWRLTNDSRIAKQCAMVAVDEVVANIEPSVSMDVISARIKYWKQVEEEINKL